MRTNLLGKLIPLLLVIVMVQGVAQWVKVDLLPAAIWFLVQALILIGYAESFLPARKKNITWVCVFLIWVLFQAVRGVFLSEGYWDYKSLVENLMVFLLPMAVVRYADPKAVQQDGKLLLLFVLPLFVIFVWEMQSEAVGRFFFFLPFFLLFLPDLKIRHSLYVLFMLAVIILFGTIGARAMMFRLAAAVICCLPLFLRRLINTERIIGTAASILFIAPFALLVIYMTTSFNIFSVMEGNRGKYVIYDENGALEEEDLAADTRTFIYVESITSAWRNNYVLHGHSLSRGYESETFGDADLISLRRGERANGEVGILNVFTHMGLIGGFLYLFIFIAASASAIRKSRSLEMKVLGLWIAIRWFMSWVEEFTMFDINNVYLWVTVGMCLSPTFQEMDSARFRRFINGCFPFNKVVVSGRDEHFRSISG